MWILLRLRGLLRLQHKPTLKARRRSVASRSKDHCSNGSYPWSYDQSMTSNIIVCYLDRLAHAGGKGLSFGMDPTRFRLRYILGIIAAATLTAAALRHFVHVDGGFSREEIRTYALVAAVLVVLDGRGTGPHFAGKCCIMPPR